MTDNDRIEKLEVRVDRLEQSIAADIKAIREAINSMAVQNAKTACPSPGACVQLSHDLSHALKYLDASTQRVERLELKIIDIEREAIKESKKTQDGFHRIEIQKAWILGAWSAVALVASVVGAALTIWINQLLK